MAIYNYDRYRVNTDSAHWWKLYNLTSSGTRGTAVNSLVYNVSHYSRNAFPDNGPFDNGDNFYYPGKYWFVYYGLVTNKSRGSYVDTIQAEDGTYPDNGASGSYWYVKGGLVNRGPLISGSDLNLGAKVDNFDIEYIVTDPDAGDVVTVEIKINSNVIQTPTQTSLGVKRYVNINIAEFALGEHKVYIIAKDKAGVTATRIYTFTKTNTAPEISGVDSDLGAKNTPFSVTYHVKDREGDKVTIYEKLNGVISKTLTNVQLEADLTITIDDETLQSLEIGKNNTIEIEARDGKGGVAYRRFTFKRTNFPPVISGTDGDLGDFELTFTYEWSATDVEGDRLRATIYFDGRIIKDEHDIIDNAVQTISFEGLDFLKIKPGKHTVRILVFDDKGGRSERLVSFTRIANRLIMQQQEVFETDVAAKRTLVVPNSKVAIGANEKVEVTNNGFDANPTWEDATSMVKAGKAFNFQNTTKNSTKWGIDSRITINRNDAPALQSWVSGWGISYE